MALICNSDKAPTQFYVLASIVCPILTFFNLGRTTPFDDRHIGRKLELLEAEDEEKLAVRNHFIATTIWHQTYHSIKTYYSILFLFI